jgi:hypothetical protein
LVPRVLREEKIKKNQYISKRAEKLQALSSSTYKVTRCGKVGVDGEAKNC